MSDDWTCDVCGREAAVIASPVPGAMGTVVAYGQRCLDADVHPYDVLVRVTADVRNELVTSSRWWWDVIERTCTYLGRSVEQFRDDVARRRKVGKERQT